MSQFRFNSESHRCRTCSSPLTSRSARGMCVACLLQDATDLLNRAVSPTAGRTFAGYELKEEIGRGAVGVVFRATQIGLNRDVAVKVLRLGPLAGSTEIARFRREAEAVARLRHPNIVAVHEVGEASGWLYIALDFVPGGDLDASLENGLPTPRMAAEWIRNLADAIAHAHSRGVIHRDLKPGNVLLDERGQPMVTDFGISRLIDQESSLTRSGDWMGTAAYMAPEQVLRRPSNRRGSVDVYSLGAILYHCLVGKPPFEEDTVAETFLAVARKEPSFPKEMAERVGRDLETICKKCLAKDPKGRYRSAEALRADLDHFLRDEPITARPVHLPERMLKWCRRHPAAALMSATPIAVAATVFFASDSERRNDAEVARQELLRTSSLLTQQLVSRGVDLSRRGDDLGSLSCLLGAWMNDDSIPGADTHLSHRTLLKAILSRAPTLEDVWQLGPGSNRVAVSSDGRFIACGGSSGSLSISDDQHAIPMSEEGSSTAPINSIAFSPDGMVLLLGEGGERGPGRLALYQFSGGQMRKQAPTATGIVCAEFSPDGAIFATASQSGEIDIWSPGGQPKVIASLGRVGKVARLQFFPDGSRLLGVGHDGTIRVWDWKSGALKATFTQPGSLRAISVDPQGTRFAMAGDDGAVQLRQLNRGDPVGEPLRHESLVEKLTFSPGGQWIVTATHDGSVRVWDSSSGIRVSPVIRPGYKIRRIAVSPDLRHLLTATGEDGIRVWDPRSGRPQCSQVGCPRGEEIAWLPKSDGFVVVSDDGLAKKWMLPKDDFAPVELTGPGPIASLQLSPDSRRLVADFGSDRVALWSWNETPPRTAWLQHQGNVTGSGFSRDGRLCFTVSEDHTARIWDCDSGQPFPVPMLHEHPVRCGVFTEHGDELITGDDAGVFRRWDTRSGKCIAQLGSLSGSAHSLRLSSDGKRLAAAANLKDANDSTLGRGEVAIWTTTNFSVLGSTLVVPGTIQYLELTPHGRGLAVVYGAGRVKMVIPDRQARNPVELKSEGEIRSLQFSRDGQHLLTANDRGETWVWKTLTGKVVSKGPTLSGVARAWYAANDQWIVTSDNEGVVQIWDAATNDLMFPPFIHDERVEVAAVDPDSHWLITGGADGRIRAWPLVDDNLSLEAAERKVVLLTGRRFDSGERRSPISPKEYQDIWRKERPRRNEHRIEAVQQLEGLKEP